MTNKLITLDRAKREAERLVKYIGLVESHDTNNINQWIIKQYAITNSIKKILEIAHDENITLDGSPLTHEYVVELINGNPTSDLHRILRLGYRRKIKPTKRKW